MRKLSLILLFTCFVIPLAFAQQKTINKPDGTSMSAAFIDQTTKKLMDTADITGLCIGMINNNKPAYVKGYGFKNKAKSELIDTTTCFYAASLAKPLFAYIVVQLAQEGMIDLDKPLYTYLPNPYPGMTITKSFPATTAGN